MVLGSFRSFFVLWDDGWDYSSGCRSASTYSTLYFFRCEEMGEGKGGCGRAVGAGRMGGSLQLTIRLLQLLQLQPRARVYLEAHTWMDGAANRGMQMQLPGYLAVQLEKFLREMSNARPLRKRPAAQSSAQRARQSWTLSPVRRTLQLS